MLTNERIQQILNEGEGLTTEFKRCADKLPKSTYETVGSFANRYGGYILLGVSDDGEVLGVNPNAVASVKKDFSDTINNSNKTTPALFLSFEETEIDGKTILYVYVPRSSQIQMISGRIYDRKEDGDYDITGSTELIAQMSIRKSDQFTERKVFPKANESHLKLAELMPIIRQRAINRVQDHPWGDMDNMEIMRSAGLYEDNPVTGEVGFNRAAILLFGRDEAIQQVVPGYVTDCLLRIDNVDRYDDRVRVEANLIESFDLLMEFIAKHTLDRFYLIDNLNVSVRSHIAKEVVSNILCHREFSGTFPARIIIEKDRILAENWNRPLNPGRINPNNYEPYPKNPIIARFFVNIGFADTLGSGVRNLYKYTKIYSGAEPELIEGDIFKTIIPIKRSSIRFSGEPLNEPVSEPRNEPVNMNVRQVFELLRKNGSLTKTELADQASVSRATVTRALKALQESGMIIRVGADKTGHWEIIATDQLSSDE
jgi:ATP-dependent DNA helicase RecG